MFVWFTCPSQKVIRRRLYNVPDANKMKFKDNRPVLTVSEICPFIDHMPPVLGERTECDSCIILDIDFPEMVNNFFKRGYEEYSIDYMTLFELERNPRAAFYVFRRMTEASLKERKMLERMLIFEDKYTMYNDKLLFENIQLNSPEEFKYVERFDELYPSIYFKFNYEIMRNSNIDQYRLYNYFRKVLSRKEKPLRLNTNDLPSFLTHLQPGWLRDSTK